MGNKFDCLVQHKTFRDQTDNFQVYVRKGETVRDACFRKLAQRRGSEMTEMVKHYEIVNTRNLGQPPASGSIEEQAALFCDGRYRETDRALACREGTKIMKMKLVEALKNGNAEPSPSAAIEMPKGKPPKVRIIQEGKK